MSLIPCADCGREISSFATACVHCGCPVSAAAPASAAPPLSTADELLKLKKLYDQKVLTKAEYDAQKAKLLK